MTDFFALNRRGSIPGALAATAINYQTYKDIFLGGADLPAACLQEQKKSGGIAPAA